MEMRDFVSMVIKKFTLSIYGAHKVTNYILLVIIINYFLDPF